MFSCLFMKIIYHRLADMSSLYWRFDLCGGAYNTFIWIGGINIMGCWDTTLYGNDMTADIRDEYRKLLEDQKTDEEAYRGIMDQFREIIDTDEEPLLWYALADSMWKYGRMTEEIRNKALYWIERKGGIGAWIDSHDKGRGWQKTLDKLKKKLDSPMPKRKKVLKPKPLNGDPWKMYDIYAYQFPDNVDKYLTFDNSFESNDALHRICNKPSSLKNKYILIQKVGNTFFYEKNIMQVRTFANIYETVPSLADLHDITLLPFNHPQNIKEKKKLQTSAAARIWFKNSEYPKSQLFYVGNRIIVNNPEKPIINPESTMYSFSWEFVYRDLGNKIQQWKGRKYYEEEPGVYVYDPNDAWL